MQNEINQYDIPSYQMLTAREARRTERHTEIGEAVVVHTIFGRAKVRTLRKHHNPDLWRSVAIVVVASSALALFLWKGVPQSPEPSPRMEAPAVPAAAAVPPDTPALTSAPAPGAEPRIQAVQSEPVMPAMHDSQASATENALKPQPAAAQPMIAPGRGEPVRKAQARKESLATPPEERAQVTGGSEQQPQPQARASQRPQSPATQASEQVDTVKPGQSATDVPAGQTPAPTQSVAKAMPSSAGQPQQDTSQP